MLTQLRKHWQQLRELLWFVPGLMVLGACVLAYGVIEFDSRTSFDGDKQFPLLFGAGAEGSRGMLTAIAGSMLTVAALVFSLTLSSISQASSQYSPRVLRNFMRDRGNQVVMGYFVGVFTYCLIVLGTIRGNDEQRFVPSTAVLLGLLFALGGVVALIYFIHHIAESIQSGTILQRICDETMHAIEQMFPQVLGHPAEAETSDSTETEFKLAEGWQQIRSTKAGYVQGTDVPELLRWAEEHHALLRVEQPIGSFVHHQAILFSVRPDTANAASIAPDALATLHRWVGLSRHRGIEQDVVFGVVQLVDISLKALSSSSNDTTTAIMAINQLGVVCQCLASRPFPARLRSHGQRPRVLVQAQGFADYMKLAFDLVRINAKGNHAVLRHLLGTLLMVREAACSSERQAVLDTQVELLLRYADQTLATDYEKQAVRSHNGLLRPIGK